MIAALLLVAPGITKAVDLVRNLTAKWTAPKWVWNIAAFAFGIVFCVWTRYSVVPAVVAGRALHLGATVNQIITGIALGGLAGGYHEGFDAISGLAKTFQPSVVAESLPATDPEAPQQDVPGVTPAA